MSVNDLVGGTEPAGDQGALAAVNQSLEGNQETPAAEIDLVKQHQKEYDAARAFDEHARKQYAMDRKYAAGISDPNWASDANLIGSFIDILVSFLYAKNPDVGCRPAEKLEDMPEELPTAPPTPALPPGVPGLTPPLPSGPASAGAPPAIPGVGGPPMLPGAPPAMPGMPGMPPAGGPPEPPPLNPDDDGVRFARTSQLVVSKLWLLAKLKKSARRQVRSALTVGVGWVKALMYSQKIPQPQLEAQCHDEQSLLETLQAQKDAMRSGDSTDDIDLQMEKIRLTMQGIASKIEKSKRYGLAVDFCRAEDIQISLDVCDTQDYLDADWVSHDLYVTTDSLKQRFARLTADDVKTAAKYYQRDVPKSDTSVPTTLQPGEITEMGQFTKHAAQAGDYGTGTPVSFAKVVEQWDHRDGNIYTFVEGVTRWAVPPYPPPQATTRYYPFFRLALFEVDGQRHPQSLSWRLRKLQDEYSSCRSAQRTTRQRSVPSLLFNAGAVTKEDMAKVTNAAIGENIPINPTDGTSTPLQNVIIQKPLPSYQAELYNTAPITTDMERISGVQEALQSAMSSAQPKTATEAQINQTGFASRTSADRDTLEDMLTDMAQYTLEGAIQECLPEWVQRLVGKNAFWPYGMDHQDILTLVEVDINAGTTGKPNSAAEKAAWATILPMLTQMLEKIRMIQATDPAMATAMTNLLRETLHRLDDRLDIDEFIPAAATAPPPPPLPPPPPPQVRINLDGKVNPGETQQILETEAAHSGMAPPPGAVPAPAPPAMK